MNFVKPYSPLTMIFHQPKMGWTFRAWIKFLTNYEFVNFYRKDRRFNRAENKFIGESMTRIWDWMFRRRKKRKLLNLLQAKARQNPQDYRVQVLLGNLLAKMGQKEAAIEVYRD